MDPRDSPRRPISSTAVFYANRYMNQGAVKDLSTHAVGSIPAAFSARTMDPFDPSRPTECSVDLGLGWLSPDE